MNQKTLHKITYGLYIISAEKNGKLNGQIANTAVQVTADPAIMTVCLNKQNLTHELIDSTGRFTISILSQNTPLEFIGHFGFKSGRDIEKFTDVKYKMSSNDTPIVLENTVGYIVLDVEDKMDAYTHTIFKGRVVDAEIFNADEVLTYAHYHDVKNGKSPKTAPVYIEEDEPDFKSQSEAYQCSVCGYIYDPAKEDPSIPFDELPDDWVCPVCTAKKSAFKKMV